MSSEAGVEGRWTGLGKILCRAGPMSPDGAFEPGPANITALHNCKVLVVGAGGLGCELLKNLALSAFQDIHVIDMDTIDLSNLNRQFLFRECDVGRFKAETAADFINKRIPGARVTPHNCRIEDKDKNFYLGFNVVICGLDSVGARRWLNAMLVDCLEHNEDGSPNPSTIIPLIDGGTEGFKGNARVIFPGFTACVECSLFLYPPQVNYPMCTIAHTPRLPQHCVEYARLILWEKEAPFGDVPIDGDDPDHLRWLFQRSKERADEYGIQGVTHSLTQGVVKRIIPAVASTNAVIAAACTIEALKIVTSLADFLDNYVNFQDSEGVSASVVQLEKREDCPVCSQTKSRIPLPQTAKLRQLINLLIADYQMKNPSLSVASPRLRILYMPTANLAEATRPNLAKTLAELELEDGTELSVADPTTPRFVVLYMPTANLAEATRPNLAKTLAELELEDGTELSVADPTTPRFVVLYMPTANLAEATRPNLAKTLAELELEDGTELSVADPTTPRFVVLYMPTANLAEATRPNLAKTLAELELEDGTELSVADPTTPRFVVLYMPTANLAEATRPNLAKTLAELELEDGTELSVADPTTPRTLIFRLCIDNSLPMEEEETLPA